jgi:hypothetical protein
LFRYEPSTSLPTLNRIHRHGSPASHKHSILIKSTGLFVPLPIGDLSGTIVPTPPFSTLIRHPRVQHKLPHHSEGASLTQPSHTRCVPARDHLCAIESILDGPYRKMASFHRSTLMEVSCEGLEIDKFVWVFSWTAACAEVNIVAAQDFLSK